MKHILTTIAILFAVTTATAQEPKDTTIAVTLSLNQFRALLATIDANIDSKRASKELIEFLQQNAKMIQPATDWNKKAQEAVKQIENKPKNK